MGGGLEDKARMGWRPIPIIDYVVGVLGGLALGAAIATAAIWTASVLP